MISRIGSLLIAVGYLIAFCFSVDEGQGGNIVIFAIVLLLPLALIWFPDALGDYIGPVRGGYIDQQTPAVIVALAGWFFLVGMPLILYFVWRPRE